MPEHPDTPAGPAEADLAAYVAAAAADPLFREAIEVSSPSLARVLAGDTRPTADALRRAATAVGRYRLRMTTRPTPFGLLAGVALARFGDEASVRWGDRHRPAVRPDLGWLSSVVDRLHQDPAILPALHLVADQQHMVRGDRVTLPYVPTGGDDIMREVSIRHTAVVEAALRLAADPVPFPELTRRVRDTFPAAPADAVAGLVHTLVLRGFLHTDLLPPPDADDPLAHVVARIPDHLPLHTELAAVRADLRRCEELPAGGDGARLKALRVARERMTALCPADHVLQVDLALDVDMVLPHGVREEFERTAAVLWRLSPPRAAPAHLRAYHQSFVERYGTERAVPVSELLDAETGLGPPEGYEYPRGSAGPAAPRAGEDDAERGRLLAELAAGALADREPGGPLPDVVLDQALLDRLTHPEPGDGDAAHRVPTSLELYGELIGDGAEFTVMLSPVVGSDVAGATFGRFAGLLGGPGLMADVSGSGRAARRGGPVPVHLEFRPARPRYANITRTPRWLDHRVVISAFPDPAGPHVLPLDDLAVSADIERLTVHSRSLGRPVEVRAHHVLNQRTGAPNVARFLHEVSLTGHRPWQPWDWGAANALPALPRVRHGRTVLAPATWRLNLPTDGFGPWCAGLADWRRRWSVPAAVRLVTGDQRISLDLELPWHQQLLYTHARTAEHTVLQEELTSAADGGPLGPAGRRTVELVVALHATEAPEGTGTGTGTAAGGEGTSSGGGGTGTSRPAPPPEPVRRTSKATRLPGGDWLYARLDAAELRHDTLLAEHLPLLLAALPAHVDRWFFIRYRDPAPHLRIRIHGEAPGPVAALLPLLHDWAADLRGANLVSGLRLDTYDAELERYGGEEAMAAAERVFHADSLAALAGIEALRGRTGPERDLLAAVNAADVTRHFLDGAQGPPPGIWFPAAFTKSEHDHRAFREHRAAVLRAIGPDGPAPDAAGPALREAWQDRAARLADYGRLLARLHARDPKQRPPASVNASLIHMSHNRLVGIDPAAEGRAHALARGAFAAHRARARAQEAG
ncbi:lantibiotic dehydratase [Streptomyces sp. NPDC048416]|uniref:lantibiotic dehydratase n=1 Tax=Streptomyces sp. NPDC048416 TaxID=3365546 RepID=UPI00371925A5